MSENRAARAARRGGVLLLAVVVCGCGGGGSTGATPTIAAAPAFVFTGPTIPAGSGGEQELFVAQRDGSGVTQLTFDGTIKFLPHFSNDGRTILFTKFLSGGYGVPNAVTAVAVLDMSTMHETVLTHDGVSEQAAYSPDNTRIVHNVYSNMGLWVMNADGLGATLVGRPSGAASDLQWADPVWSSDNWIYFTVEQNVGGCLNVRLDRIRPDGSARTQITDGGPNCSQPNHEPTGDADPGVSPDGTTLYSSRGLAGDAPGLPGHTLRHLYTFSSAPYVAGKTETDISAALEPNCIAGVPKVSPRGTQVAVFLLCADGWGQSGEYLTTPTGSSFTYLVAGFGADWNPAQ